MKTLKQLRDKLEQTLSIVDVARKLGIEVSDHNYALCPFHNDHKPSMRLFEDASGNWGKHYHCFACNAHGGMIDLVKGILKTDYTQALKWLAANFGIQYRDFSQYLNKDDRQNSQELLRKILDEMNNKKQLEDWANMRELPVETLIEAGIIYVEKQHNILKSLRDRANFNNSHNIELLVSLGLIIKLRPKGGYKDSLEQYADINSWLVPAFDYDHVLIPVMDKDKYIVGFAARRIDENDTNIPKYKYSYGFKRSENLYGFEFVYEQLDPKHRASLKSSVSSSIDLFIVEGMLDVIRLRSLGFYAVGVLGSSLTHIRGSQNDQASLITLLARLLVDPSRSKSDGLNCNLFLDNDEAGRSGNLSAIFKLMEVAIKQFNLHINISIPYLEGSPKIKDPDELFRELKITERSTEPNSDAHKYLSKVTFSILEYLIAYQLNVPVCSIPWDALDNDDLRKSQLNRELFYQLKDYADLLDIIKINKVYLNNKEKPRTHAKLLGAVIDSIHGFTKPRKTPSSRTIGKTPRREIIDKDLLHLAVSSAKSSYTRSEFSYDIYAFDKINSIIELFQDELEEILATQDIFPLEPYTPALEARDGNNHPRLKTLPCPEDLVIQDLILLSLIDETLMNDNSFQIPCVIFHNELKTSKLYGPHKYKPQRSISAGDKKDEVVSFAYQFNFYAQATNPYKSPLFRSYLDCWMDFNDYILNCVRSYPQGLEIYAERYDIKRYYDRIKIKHISSLLHGIFAENYERSVFPSDRESLINLILRYSFDYPFYAPDSGEEERWPDPNMGIPQGPNLSAWLANALLFLMDKYMQGLVDDINTERQDGKRIALYARYVDDIILIAPSMDSLQSLENALRDELDKLDLSLSEKVDPVSSYLRRDFTKFLYENKGLPGVSLGISDQVKSSISISRSMHKIRVQSGDRKDVLNILHYYNPFELYERNLPELLLKASVKYAATLKEKDFLSIARFLWVEIFSSCNKALPKKNPISDIAQKLSDAFRKHILSPNELKNSENDLGRFIEPLYHHRYLLMSIMGLNLALSNKYHRNPLLSDSEQEVFAQGREHFIAYAKNQSDYFRSEHYTKDDHSISKLEFLLELYLRKTWQLVNLDKPEASINNHKTRHFQSPIIRRFESGTQGDTANSFAPITESINLIVLYNELWLAKLGHDPSGSDHSTKGSCFATALKVASVFSSKKQNGTDTPLAKYVYHIIPRLEIPATQMCSFLLNRKEIQCLLAWDGNGAHIPFLLPSYKDITDDTFIGLNISDNGQIQTANLFFPQGQDSTFWDQEMVQKSKIENFAKLMNYKNARFEFDPNWKLLISSRTSPFKKIVRLIVELYRYIENEKKAHHLLNSLMINSSNIIYREDNGGYEVKLISKNYPGESKIERYYLVHNTANELYKGRDELQQLYPYSYVWRLGWALNDLFGTIQLSEADFVGVQKKLLEGGDWIDEAILLRVLFDLKGVYWKGAEENNALPKHIQNHIEFLSEIDSVDNTIKTLYLLKSQLDRRTYAVLKQHETIYEFDYETGLKLLSNIAETLFHYDQQMIQHLNDTLFKDIQIDNQGFKNSRRSIYAWIVLSRKFAEVLEVSNLNATNPTYAEYMREYSYLCRLRVVSILVRKLFILSSQFCYEKMGDKIAVDVSISNLPSEKLTDLQYIFRSINEDGMADPLNKESIIMQIKMLMAIIDVYKSLFTPEDYKNIDHELRSLLSLVSAPAKENFRQFANLQRIEYPNIVTDSSQFSEFVNKCDIIEETLGIRTSSVHDHSLSIGFTDDAFSIVSTQGSYRIPFCSLLTEKLYSNDNSSIEKNFEHGRELNTFSEVYIGEQLKEIDAISNNLADLSGIRGRKTNSNDNVQTRIDPENKPDKSEQQVLLEQSEDIEQEEQIHLDGDTLKSDPMDNITISQDNISDCIRELKDYQRIKWESRAKHNRMLRIAFFQFEVDSTYRHPLSEICSYDYENKEFLKKPWKFTDQAVSPENPQYNEFFSCAELIRQEKLKAAIEACIAFDVDLLILPEYSVRPETIEIIKDILMDKSASLTVLCGTFRIPLLADSRYLSKEFETYGEVSRQGHSSLLSLLYKSIKTNQYKIKSRGKKYRSEASNEIFRPIEMAIEPLGKNLKVNKDNVVNHILELICSECFILTSPIQHDWLAESWLFLKNKYDPSVTQTQDNLEVVKDDIRELREAVIGPRNPFTSDTRKLLIVPSMTSRVRDFYNLGEQFILTVSGSMVLCNSVFGKHGKGGSCIISGESYHDKQDDVWVPQCDGPYGDVQPGIYQRGAFDEGALGQDEEALVIFDINPLTATDFKPSKQARPNGLRLVAHLPIVQYSPADIDIDNICDLNCACLKLEKYQRSYTKRVRTHKWVAAYSRALHTLMTKSFMLEAQSKPMVGFNPNSPIDIPDECHCENLTDGEREICRKAHEVVTCPQNRVCHTPLSTVFINMFGTKGNRWIEKKIKEFFKQHGNKQFLHSEFGNTRIPVAFLDFLLIDYSHELKHKRSILKQRNCKYLKTCQNKCESVRLSSDLSVPPFSMYDNDGYGE
jgi:DNA primase catalytic core